ncbi:MAG: hypothetical protein WBX25_20390 [Rhodomicrobium sp.]
MTRTTKAPYLSRNLNSGTANPQEIAGPHKFTVGQNVQPLPGPRNSAASGPYKIGRLMPASGTDLVDPRYRIKSEAEKFERVVAEYDLTSSDSPQTYLPGRRDFGELPG